MTMDSNQVKSVSRASSLVLARLPRGMASPELAASVIQTFAALAVGATPAPNKGAKPHVRGNTGNWRVIS